MIYFDNASTTLKKPKEVIKCISNFYNTEYGNPGRNLIGNSKSNFVNELRENLKETLSCENKDVVFTPTATIALNMCIQGLIKKNKKNIYVSHFEHNSVMRVLYYYKALGKITINIIDTEFNSEQIKNQFESIKPDLLIMTHASNVSGIILPIEDVFAMSKKYEAVTILDMAQTAGLIDINLNEDIYDIAVFAGHKTLYGPTGISGFVIKKELNLEPILFGGTGFDSANEFMPDQIPEKFEMGTFNSIALIGLNESLKWIKRTGIANIREKEERDKEKLNNLLDKYWFIKKLENNKKEKVGIISFIINGIPSDSAESIFYQKDLVVRTGLQCSPLAHKYYHTFPTGTIRISTSYFTTNEDFNQLEKCLNYIEENL